MVLRVGGAGPMIACPIGSSRSTRQRRVELLWVQACGGQVFMDPSGRRFAIFDANTTPARAFCRKHEHCIVEAVPADWLRLA
jgi:hypothetical protein